jgi:hypothetical protein
MSRAKTAKEVLIAARWIIKHVGWCQGTYAKDVEGFSVDPMYPDAACFCLSGVLDAVETDADYRSQAWQVLNEHILNNELGLSIVSFNDKKGRTKEEVLSLLDNAIKEAP